MDVICRTTTTFPARHTTHEQHAPHIVTLPTDYPTVASLITKTPTFYVLALPFSLDRPTFPHYLLPAEWWLEQWITVFH